MGDWDTTLPQPFWKLHQLKFDYAGGEGIDFEPYSHFKTAAETGDWIRAWTGNKEIDGGEFRIFGEDGTGGFAAFWLVELHDSILKQPVVFFGSEGEVGMVATNFEHYLWLLANGIGPYEAIAYPGMVRKQINAFLDFAKENSRTGPLKPDEVLTKVQSAYPRFSEKIRSLCR